MDHIPAEILDLIIRRTATSTNFYERTLCKTALISKRWTYFSQSLLYANIVLDCETKALGFLATHYARDSSIYHRTKRLKIAGNLNHLTIMEVMECISLRSELERMIISVRIPFDISLLSDQRFKAITYLEINSIITCPAKEVVFPFTSLNRLHILNQAVLCECVLRALIVPATLIDLVAFPKDNSTQTVVGSLLEENCRELKKLAFTSSSRTPNVLDSLTKLEYFTGAFKTDPVALRGFLTLINSICGDHFKSLDITIYGELTEPILDKIMPIAEIVMKRGERRKKLNIHYRGTKQEKFKALCTEWHKKGLHLAFVKRK